jgi:hypothetical protein
MPFNFQQGDNFASGLAKGASKGLEEYLGPALDEARKSRIASQMLSERIGAEIQAKQQEAQFQQQLNSIPQDQFEKMIGAISTYRSALNQGKVPPPLDVADITHPAAQNVLSHALTTQDSAGNQTVPMTIDGRQVLVTHNRAGQVIRQTDMGLDKKSQQHIADAQKLFLEGTNFLEGIRDMTKGLMTATGLSSLPAQYANLSFEKIAQNDPKAKAYFDTALLHAQRLEKMISGSSRVPEQLIQQAEKSIPTMFDTFQTAQAKIDALSKIFQYTRDASLQAYSRNPSEILKDFNEAHDGSLDIKSASERPPQNPSGLSADGFAAFMAARSKQPK